MIPRRLVPWTLVGVLVAAPAADVPPEALTAFHDYARRLNEEYLDDEPARPFLRIDRLSGPERDGARARALRGVPWVASIEPRDADGRELDLEGGVIHHWVGAVFVAGAGLDPALDLALDLDRYAEVFAPDVVEAHLTERRGDSLRAHLRFQKRKVVTLTYDTDQRIDVRRPGPGRAWTHAEALTIREVEEPGSSRERLRPVGEGRLHGLHGWWRYRAVDGGVWIETESLVLTDDVPFPASLLVGPLLRAGPREGVERALAQTVSALRTTARRLP